MYCEELDRLLQTHSTLTLEFYRQDARTQGWYASTEDWARECEKLQVVEQALSRVMADVMDHRRQHGCGGAAKRGAGVQLGDRQPRRHEHTNAARSPSTGDV